MSFAVNLFSLANGALFVGKKLRLWVRINMVSFRVGVSCRSSVSAGIFQDIIDLLCSDRR